MTDPNIKKSDDSEDIDSFKYIINFFTSFDIEKYDEENKKNNTFYDLYYEDMKKIPEEEFNKIRKVTQKDLDLNYLKIYLQLKNDLDQIFGENYIEENEIIRCLIGLKYD